MEGKKKEEDFTEEINIKITTRNDGSQEIKTSTVMRKESNRFRVLGILEIVKNEFLSPQKNEK